MKPRVIEEASMRLITNMHAINYHSQTITESSPQFFTMSTTLLLMKVLFPPGLLWESQYHCPLLLLTDAEKKNIFSFQNENQEKLYSRYFFEIFYIIGTNPNLKRDLSPGAGSQF